MDDAPWLIIELRSRVIPPSSVVDKNWLKFTTKTTKITKKSLRKLRVLRVLCGENYLTTLNRETIRSRNETFRKVAFVPESKRSTKYAIRSAFVMVFCTAQFQSYQGLSERSLIGKEVIQPAAILGNWPIVFGLT